MATAEEAIIVIITNIIAHQQSNHHPLQGMVTIDIILSSEENRKRCL
jgi:hypothetical protein